MNKPLLARARLSTLANREESLHSELSHVRDKLSTLHGQVMSIADAVGEPDINDAERLIRAVHWAIKSDPAFSRAVRQELGR